MILSDCKRADWDPADLAEMLERTYHFAGPAIAAEIWNLLKSLVFQYASGPGSEPRL